MNPPILGLRTCIFKVPELKKAKAWYTEAFKVQPYFDEPFYIGFNVGGFELGLQPTENPMTEKPENVLVYWGVEDIEKEYQRFLKLGATEHEAPTNVGGELMVATVRDPWKNLIGLIFNPYFKIGN